MYKMKQPFVAAQMILPEITLRAVILAILLAALLAAANTYLALKIGMLTSASIPAAVMAMGVLRFFKQANILESNQVQTAASAGEAVAGGIVYTIPALVIINYWSDFGYVENFLLALTGGLLGVLFSIPIRQILMQEPSLKFPEGRTIAELLKAGSQGSFGLKQLLMGSGIGGLLELLQSGFKVVADGVQFFFANGHTIFGFGMGFSSTMIGAGYLIGFRVGLSFLLGALINWLICLPILSSFYAVPIPGDAQSAALNLGHSQLRFIGIGAMLLAGIYSLGSLTKPFITSLSHSLKLKKNKAQLRTEQDLPMSFTIMGLIVLSMVLYGLLLELLPIYQIGFAALSPLFIVACILYILLIGFIFSAICGYFSGMVGVSASPGSAIIIAAMLIVALVLRMLLGEEADAQTLQHAAAVTIIIGSVVAGAACIANDNIQDLKVGHIIGATPKKQQIMLMLGVVVAAAVIPLVMQLLYKVYGIAGSVPRSEMDITATLPAPPAALMAAVTEAVFHHQLPWHLLSLGMLITSIAIGFNYFLSKSHRGLSLLGIATGMYLPISTSTALCIGGVIAYIINHRTKQQPYIYKQRGSLLACGIVAGSALMDVLLAIPMALLPKPDMLAIMPTRLEGIAILLGIIAVISLAACFNQVTKEIK